MVERGVSPAAGLVGSPGGPPVAWAVGRPGGTAVGEGLVLAPGVVAVGSGPPA